MKSKMLLGLAGLLIVSMLAISLVSGESVIYRANGTLDTYNPDYPGYGDAMVVVGSWAIKIEDGAVDFKARYLEENILEEIPGTIDKFMLVLTSVDSVTIDGSNCEILGTIVWYKIGWDHETGKPKFQWPYFDTYSKITINTSGIWIDIWFSDGIWEIEGSTLSIHY